MFCEHQSGLWKVARCSLGLSFLLSLCGCFGLGPSGVTTTSQVTVVTGNVAKQMPDPTAVTIINAFQPHTEGCYANGPNIAQPPFIIGWDGGVGSSPSAGKCHFGDLAGNKAYSMSYFSARCGGSLSMWEMADSSGNISPVSVCTIQNSAVSRLDIHFARTAQFPSTVTFTTPGLSSAYGFPQLLVYDVGGNMVGQSTALSVATDGSNATFPFPLTSSGTNLTSGMYMFAIQNFSSNGSYTIPDATHFTVGQDTSTSVPFGVDAVDIQITTSSCFRNRCTFSRRTAPASLVTLYNANQLVYQGSSIAVGANPVMAKAFRTSDIDLTPDSDTISRIQTAPSLALVVNQGSNNISVVDLNQLITTNTISVGSQPIALALKPDETKAYVANYGSGSITEIDLSTFMSARTLQVGNGPMSLAMDPGGAALWVGGQSYLSKVDLNSFTVVSSTAVNGGVSSLAASVQQNELVFSLIGNTSDSSALTSTSTFGVIEMALSTMTMTGSYNTMTMTGSYNSDSAGVYGGHSMSGTLPNPAANPGGTQISQQWNNGMGISATPTGFVIYDLTNHSEIMRGTTPTPIRGIASDPNNWVVYLTLPESNDLITIPLPH